MNPKVKVILNKLLTGALIFLLPVSSNMAALTDLADSPVTTMTTTNVLPNLMFVIDDSGSMQQDYTPDYVNDVMCYDALDYHSILDNTTRPCFPGDPLFMSPDFNYQYYNPDIYYEPPVNSSGTPLDTSFDSKGNQNPVSAKTDPYGKQLKDMLQNGVSTFNLTTDWPDREWCDTSSGGNCVKNTAATGYRYPDSTYGFGQGKSGCDNYDTFYGNGSKCINYVKGAPYYWRIEPSEQCTNSELTTCSPIGATPANLATLRWCTDYTLTNCQARKMGSYNYPRMIGKIGSAPTKPVYTITFTNVPQNKSYSTGSAYIRLTIGGTVYNLLSTGSVSGTTSNSNKQGNRNNSMASAIRGLMSNSNFTFTVSSNAISITANTAGTAFNGGVLSINLPANTGTATPADATTNPPYVAGTSGTGRQNAYTMTRVDIVPAVTSYPQRSAADRPDCVSDPKTPTHSGSCSYAEELQNFANWFSYYRTRLQSMKTAASLAFKPIDNKFRVGFTTINYTGTTNGSQFLNISDFDATQKSSWYQKLHGTVISGSTPLRGALKKVGDIYAGRISGAADPVQYSCQQNFTLLTTDGYWNETFSGFGNYDNVETAPFSSRNPDGVFDGGTATNASDTLADVAFYYYKTDLRPAMTDDVFTSAKDSATHQHMVTFTLGLGVSGVMKYTKDYETDANGDFARIKAGTPCAWSGGAACNWPVPVNNTLTAVDDLWHAAINGRGQYFSARDPAELVSGLKTALSAINSKVGAGAAGATSTPFITTGDNSLYITTFMPDSTHNDWQGEVQAYSIDPLNGQILPGILWTANPGLNTQMSPTDARTIYTWNGAKTAPKSFAFASLTTTEQAYFTNKGSYLGQYGTLLSADQATLNDGTAMVNFLRGQSTGLGTVFRDRQKILGDTVHAKPVYVRVPRPEYTDAGFAAYKTAQATRAGTLYVGANDGMVHAFDGTTGAEKWAYVPKMLMPNMYLLAEKFYYSGHRFFVDGEQVTSDVRFANGTWKTILVVGMGKGGRGFAALDVTDPNNPVPLWEFCNDSSLCSQSDSNIGYSFGNPVVTKRKYDGKWVVIVTSGHNNVSPGDGKGWVYVLDAETGAILDKVSNNSGSTGTPSGLSKINVWVDNPQYDNTGMYVYGADLNGDLWRFDLTTSSMSVLKIGTFKNASSQIQPVTTKPELVECDGKRTVVLGTGKLLGQSDIASTSIQSIYAVVDLGVTYTATTHGLRDSNLVQQTASTSGNTITVTSNPVNVAGGDNGWYLDMTAGERVNVDPFVALGAVAMAGNIPSNANPCQAGGQSNLYTVGACTGAGLGVHYNNAMVAGLTGIQIASGNIYAIVQMTDATTRTEQLPTSVAMAGGRRVSWRELVQ